MWLVMIAIMTIFAMCKPIGYDFIEALYFAVSSCSTGGHWSIPAEDNWVYGVVGLFAAIGVPLMGIAMASLASFLVHGNDLDGARDAIYEVSTVHTYTRTHTRIHAYTHAGIHAYRHTHLTPLSLSTHPLHPAPSSSSSSSSH